MTDKTEKIDLSEFKELVRKSIGARSQVEFAKDCGLTASHLNRLINEQNQTTPQVKTIRNIALTAANGVTLNELLVAAGYDPQIDHQCVYSEDGKSKIAGGITAESLRNFNVQKAFREELISLRECIRPYDDFNDVFGNLHWDCEHYVEDLHHVMEKEEEIKNSGCWVHGADYSIEGQLKCMKNNQSIAFDFLLYYCKTDKGKIIIMDTDWDF